MRWSLPLGRAFGIPVHVHATFGLVLVLGATQWGARFGAAGAAFGVAFTLLIFACVLLHELGHAVTARHLGIPVVGILLLPIGGVAGLGAAPRRPRDEILIAGAGPLVNLVLAFVLGAVLLIPGVIPPAPPIIWLLSPSWRALVALLFISNVALAVFNMLPVFPLDGGRVFRALLTVALGRERATNVAAAVGQLAALAFGVHAVIAGRLLLVLVALFVFMAAGRERQMVARAARRELTPMGLPDPQPHRR